MKPRIGIVVCGLHENNQFVPNSYIQSIRYSGGLPLLIPLVRSTPAIEDYTALCSGFLFCGGADITPLLFGQEPVNGIGETNIALDIFQIRFMKHIIAARKPVLAVCRGIQILNVACGGTVFQDLSLVPGSTLNHMQTSRSRHEISHKITVEPHTILHGITGSTLYTNSFHHQALNRIGNGLTVSAHTSDGVAEAVEMPEYPFALGVQWHPESMYRTSRTMRELFASFVRAASNCT